MSVDQNTPVDQADRDRIVKELTRNVLVEAAAGTGKTSSMVRRMVALLEDGACEDIRQMVAMTFTRKAASELRSRFQVGLEAAARDAEDKRKERLEAALANVDQCFIGTIHSFCGRLLRERPVEADVDLAFVELDEEEDAAIRKETWDLYVENVAGFGPSSAASKLQELGLDLEALGSTFTRFTTYPDVNEWPMPRSSDLLDDLDNVATEVEEYVAHIGEIRDDLPGETGNDELIMRYRRLVNVVANKDDLRDPGQMMDVIKRVFMKKCKIVQKIWAQDGKFTGEDAKAELARWNQFRQEYTDPLMEAWLERRYVAVMNVMFEAGELYRRRLRDLGALSFQDLLMNAAVLLRGNVHVRRYFSKRYTHILVDEFQDTDPIQAEVLMLLTATKPDEKKWKHCVPRPGSLFVVGDPKQSIYRFRRADIVTYNTVKDIILRGDGEGNQGLLVQLFANFRTTPSIIEWVNNVFRPGPEGPEKGSAMERFASDATDQSPGYVALAPGREDTFKGKMSGVYKLKIPSRFTTKDQAAAWEADYIARFIRASIDDGLTIARSAREVQSGRPEAVNADDFLIITRNTTNLSAYAQALQKYHIPHRVTGGTALNEVEELRLLYACLNAAARPDDPVALLAALRSEMFGIDDAMLFRFKSAGGRFSYSSPVPEGLPEDDRTAFEDCFSRLARYRKWMASMPPVAAFERIMSDCGLMVLAATRKGGDVQAGSLGKAMELLREYQTACWTTTEVIDYLMDVIDQQEKYDAISAQAKEPPVVRLMNLHKVKGLEAPFVFLADTSGEFDHEPELYIDREEDKVLGYMAVFHKSENSFQVEKLAAPEGWAHYSRVEKQFQVAEALRLRYVAATRAGSVLVISQREAVKDNKWNPWKHFREFLEDDRELEDVGERKALMEQTAEIVPDEMRRAERDMEERLESCSTPTRVVAGAKEYSVESKVETGTEKAPQSSRLGAYGPHGVEWGTVIHSLLEIAMKDKEADLGNWARMLLAENEMETGVADLAVETVEAVMGSPLWARAENADLVMTEVPFQVVNPAEGVPTMIRGAMDLIFREAGGWVLVDYKTDIVEGAESLEKLKTRYAPQLDIYAKSWESGTGEKVVERGFFFVRTGRYETI